MHLFLEVKLVKQKCESCQRLIALYGTNEFAVPWRCTCNATDNLENNVRIVQYQLSLTGSGDFCRLGCCDFSDKFAKHTCTNEKVS
jgi:hypothetical protein